MDKSVTDVALEMGWELLKDFVGWNDLQGCLNADIMSCGMLAVGITPWGKGLKAVKVLYKMIDGAMAFYKRQKSARKILEQAGAACTINSFTPGTLVLLADGTSKPIEEIELGDEVLATDEGSGKSQAQPVTALISGSGDKDLVTITLAGDDGGAVVATDGHPFWVPALEAWVDAGELQAGQWLRTSAGTRVQIEQVEHETRHQRVYNLTVANDHSYYVVAGGESVLSHNCKKNQGVYVFDDLASPGQTYVGKTNNFSRRLSEHVADGRIASAEDAQKFHVCGCDEDLFVAEHRKMTELRGQGVSLSNDKASPGRQILISRQWEQGELDLGR